MRILAALHPVCPAAMCIFDWNGQDERVATNGRDIERLGKSMSSSAVGLSPRMARTRAVEGKDYNVCQLRPQ